MIDTESVRPTQYRRVYVDSDAALAPVLESLAGADAIGLDVEMGQRVRRQPGGVREWIHILALVQVAGNGISAVIDPLRCSVERMAPLMSGPVRKVLLGGGQDAAILQKSGIEPLNIADVGEVALSLFGRREDGMAALAQRIFGLTLDKTIRRADWMVRPLNPTLIAYAHQDAELTLDIYRWFHRSYPDALHAHERLHLEPGLATGTPDWLRHLTSRSNLEAGELLKQHGLDRQKDESVLAETIRAPLLEHASPRLVNRLLRAVGDLKLVSLLPDVLPLLESQSSLVRASASRAVGKLAAAEDVEALLAPVLQDPMPDVVKAAESALKEARSPKPETPAVEDAPETEETPAIAGDALSALAQLKARLEGAEG